MNKNILPIILIVLAIGIYFTYTKNKVDENATISAVNDSYKSAISNAQKLIAVRDNVLKEYNSLTDTDKDRLEKLVPDNIDNVRLIIDVSGIAARHGLSLKNIRTSAGSDAPKAGTPQTKGVQGTLYNTMTVSFGVATTYENFISLLQDVERSLRIMDISKITLSANDGGVYDYNVEFKTYWLKQ